jgi:pyridoxal phosphate enzyme (YggS family)
MRSCDVHTQALLQTNLTRIQQRIAQCATAAGRTSQSVQLVAVTKTVSAAVCAELLALGQRDLGENRADVLESKHALLAHLHPRWHWIGHLQRNKARRVLMCAEVLHSIDSLRLLEACERICADEGLQRTAFVQLKLWPEETKGGLDPSELQELLVAAREATRVRVIGLMAMGPLLEDAEAARRAADEVFARCAALGAAQEALFSGGCQLSMGMSGDYDLAIARGAHWVRVGSALYEGLKES